MDKSISAVLPMYNEQENAAVATSNMLKKLEMISDQHEVIIVESGSTDGTGEIVDGLAQNNSRVRVIHQGKREGLGSGIRAGLEAAVHDLVFYSDADSPFDLAELPRAVQLIESADMVIGFRKTRRESLKRKVYSQVYNRLIRSLFGLKVKDVNFSFKLMRREVLENISLHSNGCFIDAELLIEASRKRYEIREVGIEYLTRANGESTLANRNVVFDILQEMYKYRQSNRYVGASNEER